MIAMIFINTCLYIFKIRFISKANRIWYDCSKWVMMNHDTRRLQKVSDEVREELLVHFPQEPRLAFPEKNNRCLKKILKLEDPAQYSRLALTPRRADLDMNHHVNYVTYIG
ncbi:hypothetical protein HRI_004588500 [Hibiscus trionum]|uniref:Acyl-[acyl-carrier-protein] hydrolase n=1 Tax=Hibiscus trionum TaxID=183268 RepID=A0A9W7JAB9_HIBTR|nr:hypothetical protein HRI_004588500 [Hibiscus trionum]